MEIFYHFRVLFSRAELIEGGFFDKKPAGDCKNTGEGD
jgi:hypothetical protein